VLFRWDRNECPDLVKDEILSLHYSVPFHPQATSALAASSKYVIPANQLLSKHSN
jgi:hypothetical protein